MDGRGVILVDIGLFLWNVYFSVGDIRKIRRLRIYLMVACCNKWYEGGKRKINWEGLFCLVREGF